jgi:hypothetical protein
MRLPLYCSLFAASAFFQGCLQGGGTTEHCNSMITIESTKLLTPSDRNFELSTTIEDSAYTDGLCSVQFQLSFGFDKDSLQTLAFPAGPFAMPLTGLEGPTLFYMNDSVVFSGWHYIREYVVADFDTTLHYLSTFPHPRGPSQRGVYSIRTSLSPTVLSEDSTVYVRARIRYQNGTYVHP